MKGLSVADDVPVGAVEPTGLRAPVPVGPGWTGEPPVGKGAPDVARVEVVTAAAEVVALAEEAAADVLGLGVAAA